MINPFSGLPSLRWQIHTQGRRMTPCPSTICRAGAIVVAIFRVYPLGAWRSP